MSAFGTKRTSRHAQPMSAFGGKADIGPTLVGLVGEVGDPPLSYFLHLNHLHIRKARTRVGGEDR
jgi:hypothetical protein